MSAVVMSYAPFWPHERRAFLTSASEVAYSCELMQPGQFSFRLPVTSAQTVREGDIIGIRSAYGLPDYAGYVERVAIADGDAYAEVVGQEYTALLAVRSTRQEVTYTSGTYARIVMDVFAHANARNPTDIVVWPPRRSDAIPTEVTLRAGQVLSQVNEVATLTGWEWYPVYSCEEALSVAVVLTETAGRDMRHAHTVAGRMIAAAEYDRDIINDAQIVQLVGATGDFGSRPSAAAVSDGPVALHDIAQTVVAVPWAQTRRPQRPSLTTARELSVTRLDISDSLTVQRKAVQTIRQLAGGLEVVNLTVTTELSWSVLAAGNVVSVVLPAAEYNAGIVIAYRILGVQPDHDTGTCQVIGRVMPDA